MFLDEIKITEIMPCLADSEKIRLAAYHGKEVSKED
jgi:ArsR family metal-binding transcriptional regulator